MEEQQTQSSTNKVMSRDYLTELKSDSEKFKLGERRGKDKGKSIDEIVNETEQEATGITSDASNATLRIKHNIYSMANKVGINLYGREIKKIISKSEKLLYNLEDNKKQVEHTVYGEDYKSGLVLKKNLLKRKITDLNGMINKSYLAKEEYENKQDEFDEKIVLAESKNDFDIINALRAKRDDLSFDYDSLITDLDGFEEAYFMATDEFRLVVGEMDDKKLIIKHYGTNIQNHKKEINLYKKFLEDKSTILNYVGLNKILDESNEDIRHLRDKNLIVEEKSYFAKDKILSQTKSISLDGKNSLISDEMRKDVLRDKQERRENLSKVNDLYSQIMKNN